MELVVPLLRLTLAQTARFDATEVRTRTSDPKPLVSAVKRLRLMYEIRKTDGRDGSGDADTRGVSDREVVTGPDALFRSTRRYGTRFARLLRTVAKADRGLADASAVLSELGYAVEWEGLSGGTVRRKE